MTTINTATAGCEVTWKSPSEPIATRHLFDVEVLSPREIRLIPKTDLAKWIASHFQHGDVRCSTSFRGLTLEDEKSHIRRMEWIGFESIRCKPVLSKDGTDYTAQFLTRDEFEKVAELLKSLRGDQAEAPAKRRRKKGSK